MFSKRNFTTLMLAVGLSAGAGVFFGSHSRVMAEDKPMTTADYARDAQDHLKKAHEDVDRVCDATADKSSAQYKERGQRPSRRSTRRTMHCIALSAWRIRSNQSAIQA